MEWFNVFGLAFIVVIMIPSNAFAVKCKEGFENRWNNKAIGIMSRSILLILSALLFVPTHILISYKNAK